MSKSLSSQFLLFQALKSFPILSPATKHLTKSHPSTKKKALKTIIENIALEIPKEDVVKTLLYTQGFWDFLTIVKVKLWYDPDREIRLLSWTLIQSLIELHPEMKKALCDVEDRYLEHILPQWFLAMHDSDPDIQQFTRNLFQQCFSSKKQRKILQRYQSDILAQMMSYFSQSVHGLMRMLKIKEKDEAEEAYARFITMSLKALKTMITSLESAPKKKGSDKDLQSDSQLTQLLSNKNFWKYLIIEQFPTIRAAAFHLVGAVCETAPHLLEPHLKIMAPLVLSCFQERDPMVQQYTMEALIIFLKKYPESWNYVNVWKVVFPKLFGFLRSGSASFASKTFSILLPFISMLNFDILGSSNEKTIQFFDEYFNSMWIGYMSNDTQDFDRSFIITAYLESMMYAIMRSENYLDKSQEPGTGQTSADSPHLTAFQTALLPHLMRAIDLFLVSPEKVANEQHYTAELSKLMNKFQSRQQTHSLLIHVWNNMRETSLKALELPSEVEFARKNTFVQRLDLLLTKLETEDAVLKSAEFLSLFAQPLMEVALDCALSASQERDASLHLDICVLLCDVIPIKQLAMTPDCEQFSPSAFFVSTVQPLFDRFHSSAVTDESVREALCDFLAHFFESCPEEFSKLEELCATTTLDSIVLYHIVLKCFSVIGDRLGRSERVEELIEAIVHRFEQCTKESSPESLSTSSLTNDVRFMELVLIQFPHILSDKTVKSVLIRLVECLEHFSDLMTLSERRRAYFYISHILHVCKSLCEGHLNLFSNDETQLLRLSLAIFSLCTCEDPLDMNYVSQPFLNECAHNNFINIEDWEIYFDAESAPVKGIQEEEAVDGEARAIWSQVIPFVIDTCPSEEEKQELTESIVEDCISFLQSSIRSNHANSQTSHQSFVSTLKLVNDVTARYGTANAADNSLSAQQQIILNQSLWKELRAAFDASTTCMEVDGRFFLVTFIDSQQSESQSQREQKFYSVLNFSRFLMITCRYLGSLSETEFENLFLDKSNGEPQNLWLFYYLSYVRARNNLFHPNVRDAIAEMQCRIATLYWSFDLSSEDQTASTVETVLQRLIDLSVDFDEGESFFVIGHFIRDTIVHLYSSAGSAIRHVDILLDACLKTLLLTQSFEETISNLKQTKLFAVIVESLFQFSDPEILTFVNDHLNRRITMSDQCHTQIMEWFSKSVSLLLENTLNVVQENLPDDGSHLYNLLSVQASLTLLNNFVRQVDMGEEEQSADQVSTAQLIRVLSDFTTSMMDSYEYCNTLLPMVEQLVAKMLGIIYSNASQQELQETLSKEQENGSTEDHDSFVATFFQQHVLVVISSFDKKDSSFEDVKSRLQNFAVMEEMASWFLAQRSETRSAVEIARLLYHSMMTFFSFEKDMESRNHRNFTFFSIINRLQQKVCDSLVRGVTERIYTELDLEAKRHMSKQMIQVLRESHHAHALLAASYSLRSYKDLSCLLVEMQGGRKGGAALSPTSLVANDAQLSSELDPQFAQLLHNCPVNLDSKITETTIIRFSRGESYDHCRYELYSYLLAWDALCRLSDKSSKELRSAAFLPIKEKQSFHALLNCIISFLLHSPSAVPDFHNNGTPVDQLYAPLITFSDISRDDAGVALSLSHDGFTLFAAQLLLKMVHTFPSLVRTWYKNSNMSTAVQNALTDFISHKLAPPVVEKELRKIQMRSQKVDDHVKIQVLKNIGRIHCVYTQDDIELDLTLEIPPTYPLKSIEMKSHKRIGVSESMWRKVILKMTSMLFRDAGNIYDSIQLWIENLDKHFSGYEACPICYSILEISTYKLPDKKCSQCKQMFHSPCLVKWFSSSPEPTCPYCRGVNTFH